MAEHKLQSGYIEEMNKPYIFTYDGELLQLVPKEKDSIKPFDSFINKNISFEVLEGYTISQERIFFLNCNLQVNLSGYLAKPAGFVCFDNGEREFDTITFKGGMIDYFYRPNHIIDEKNTKYDYQHGGGEIKLKSFDDVSLECEVSIAGNPAILMLSVTLPGEPVYMQLDYNLGKPKSLLQLRFKEKIDISQFRTVYMWIYNLLTFASFCKNISLGEIYLGKQNADCKIEKVAYSYLNERDREGISNVERIVGYYFVFDHLNELIQIVNKEDLNLLVIPENSKKGKYISPQNYMMCCTSFESVFNFTFPNAKMEYSQKANEVKEEFLDYIKMKEQEYKGVDAKKRKEFRKYADMIELLDFGLEEKFSHCYLRYKKNIKDYEQQILVRFNLSVEEINNMAHAFGKKRNMLMHNSVEGFEDIHVVAYSLARVFIYVMILEKAGIDDNMIIQAIDKVL